MKSKNKKTKLTLLILIICITLGYAALRTSLNINGVASIPSVSWDVYFSNYQNSASTNVDPTTEPSTPSGTKPTTVSYAVALSEPGDLYEFTIDVVNGGTIDANINLVSKLNGEEIDSENPIPDYLTYTITDQNDQPIQTDHRLNHGVTETYKIKLLFKTDIDPEDLPSEGAVLQLDVELTATQAEKEPTDIGTFTINNYEDGYIHIGQTIPNNITTYNTPAAAMAAWGDLDEPKPYYLKHVLNENNEVTESYVGFVITDAIKTQWKEDYCVSNDELDPVCAAEVDNLVNGTYYIRGGVDESELAETPIYNSNIDVIKRAFNYTVQPDVCSSYGDFNEYYDCNITPLRLKLEVYGFVYAESNGDCYVQSGGNDGASYCT